MFNLWKPLIPAGVQGTWAPVLETNSAVQVVREAWYFNGYFPFFFLCYGDHRDLHSFPTRRSSDLTLLAPGARRNEGGGMAQFRQGYAQTNVRSEEHTSELQSRRDLVCRLLLEK